MKIGELILRFFFLFDNRPSINIDEWKRDKIEVSNMYKASTAVRFASHVNILVTEIENS